MPHSDETLEKFVRESWRLALGRFPEANDLEYLVGLLRNGRDPVDHMLELVASREAMTLLP